MSPMPFSICDLRTGLAVLWLGFFVFPQASLLQASTPELLIPAYANPCCSNTWAAYLQLAREEPAPLNLIINPNSGPGTSPIDANYVSANGKSGVLVELHNLDVPLFGYVRTNYARQPLETVLAEIDRYYSAEYWRSSDVRLSGIFLDEYSNNLANVAYYQQISEHLAQLSVNATIIGNPGVGSYFDSSQGEAGFTLNDYILSADVLVTFENAAQPYRQNYQPPAWQNDYPAGRFAHIVHTESFLNLPETLRLAVDRNVGMIYVTDDQMPNPYDKLPSFWTAEVDRLALLQTDLNLDGQASVADIDSLILAIRSDGPIQRHFDLDHNNQVDIADLAELVEQRFGSYFGDANLDGEFNSSDFVHVFTAGQYEDAFAWNSNWASGDWNGD
ncbi:MAG: spherulation-specific family 4 protein, partial [Planctomycetales bacterium]|nr:spherulation-specific family 4 protein [Planctomycetales bacterium]